MSSLRYYATLGPACQQADLLCEMFRSGITGVRLNLSHGSLSHRQEQLSILRQAAFQAGCHPELLIDLQGPELRIGSLPAPIFLEQGGGVLLGEGGIPVPPHILEALESGDMLLLDDGRLLLEALHSSGESCSCRVLRGGLLRSRKSMAVSGKEIPSPTLTEEDLENLSLAKSCGVTGVMLPFVRGKEDLAALRNALHARNASQIRILAKIETLSGVDALDSILPETDELVIARGDLGNCQPLWKLPALQKRIAALCQNHGKPFMVVTQLLASMEQQAVPTRAEVSDIFNAVLDGASSLMLTGETAAGPFPLEAVQYLVRTGEEAAAFLKKKDC